MGDPFVFVVALLVCALSQVGVGSVCGAPLELARAGQPRATIWVTQNERGLGLLAATELASYIERISGAKLSVITQSATNSAEGTLILLGTLSSEGPVSEFLRKEVPGTVALKPEGYLVRTGLWENRPVVVVAGRDEAGMLYGAYEILEQLGITFRLTGDILPEHRPDLELPELNIRHEPALKRRGFLFPVNFDNASCYSWADYEQMLNQMARMKCNYLQFWWFSYQPWVTYSYRGEPALFGDVSTKESGYQSWRFGGFGSRTSQDVKVGREHFKDYPRLAPSELQHVETPGEALQVSSDLLKRVIAHAATRNIKVWLAVEMASLPPNLARHGELVGDTPFNFLFGSFLHPLDPVNREIQANRLRALSETYPEAEGVFLNFAELYPALRTEKYRAFFEKRQPDFYEMRALSLPWLTALASIYDVRVEQAVDSNIGDFDLFQYLLQKRDEVAPGLKLGLMTVGRGYALPFFHKHLPENVPFASLESEGVWTKSGMPMHYFAGMGERETILQPRVDDDFDMLGMQFSVRQYAERDRIFVDGVRHGLAGVAGQMERARGTEFNSSYLAQAAWNPGLTPEAFYRESAERMFGAKALDDMLAALLKLEENQQYLGYYNLDGGYGTLPCCGAIREVRAAYKYWRQKDPFSGPNAGSWTNLMAASAEFIERREGSIRLLNQALGHLQSASGKIAPRGRDEWSYLVNRTETFRDTFAGLNTVRRGYQKFDEAFRTRAGREGDRNKFVAQLQEGLATTRAGEFQLRQATEKFSERIDHVSDLAVLYQMNVRLLAGMECALQHLQNVVDYHLGKPYLGEVPFGRLFPMRPDKGSEE